MLFAGCTPFREYVDNGFKVGPNYLTPPAPVETEWIDANDERVRSEADDLSAWWKVFEDPVLNNLVCTAYQQNLTLREAGFRVLAARAQLGIAIGNFFPQQQYMAGDYTRNALSAQTANNLFQFGLPGVTRFFDQWDYSFGLSWELDFWGRFRRAIEANAANLEASVANYDDVLVTLLGDVASNYVQLRSLEQQIAYTKENVELQKETLTIVEARFNAKTIDDQELHHALRNVAQTEAQV
jgi:outer membrane protein TolC